MLCWEQRVISSEHYLPQQVKLKEEQGGKTPSSPNKGNKQKAQEGKNAKEGKPPKTAKKSAKSSGDSKAEKVIVKREKKVYELPGQTRETPDEVPSSE